MVCSSASRLYTSLSSGWVFDSRDVDGITDESEEEAISMGGRSWDSGSNARASTLRPSITEELEEGASFMGGRGWVSGSNARASKLRPTSDMSFWTAGAPCSLKFRSNKNLTCSSNLQKYPSDFLVIKRTLLGWMAKPVLSSL